MSVVVERIFSQILEMSITAGYCVLAVLLLRWLFRKAPKRYTYLLWLVVAFRLVCPLTVDSAFSIFNLNLMPESMKAESGADGMDGEIPGGNAPESDGGDLSGEKLPGNGGVVSNVQGELAGDGDAVSGAPGTLPETGGIVTDQPGTLPEVDGSTVITPEIGGNTNTVPEMNGTTGDQPGAQIIPRPEVSGENTDVFRFADWFGQLSWRTVSAWAWVLGMIVLSVFMIVSWINLKLRVRTAVKVRTRVYETDAIDSAFVMGVIRPTIYLPVGLNRQEQAWILLHETCHIWRKDYVVKMFATVLTIVYWFNPLVWAAWFVMCRDMEMSCDEMALEGASGELRKAYSRTLLSVATNKRLNWNVITAFGEVSVKSRIKHILSFKKPAVWMGALFAVIMVVVLAVFGTNGKAKNEADMNAGGIVGEEAGDGEVANEAENRTDGSEEITEGSESDDVAVNIPEPKEPASKMEAMTNALWLKMLSQIERFTKSSWADKVAADDEVRYPFNESHDVEMILESFDYIDSAYSVSALYNSETVADFYWHWTDSVWTEGSMSYQNVDTDCFDIYYNYSGEPYSGWYQEEYLRAKENSVLQISGSVGTEVYEAVDFFVRSPYYYSQIWGTVLREVGDLWQRFNGDYLGQMVGEIYMESFDAETLTGVYWICLEGEVPVQLTATMNQIQGGFDLQFDVSAEWSEGILSQALMKMAVDLTTTASTVENEVSEEERFATWKENVWKVFWNYDETHPWYGDFGMFRNSVTDYDGDGAIDRKFFYILEDDYGVEYLLLSSGQMIELGETYANKTYKVSDLDSAGNGVVEFLEGDEWIDLAWEEFKNPTQPDLSWIESAKESWPIADHYTGFVDVHPLLIETTGEAGKDDFDGDGLGDRLFQRYNEERDTQEVYLFFGSGEILLLDADIWTMFYGVEAADLTGDGTNELLFTHHIIGADTNGSTFFSVFTKDSGSWERMDLPGEVNAFDNGDATDHWEKFELEKVDEDTIRIFHPDCDSSVKVSVSEYIMKLCMDGMQTGDSIEAAKGVSMITDPETGRAVLELSGELGDRWEWRNFSWQLGYVDGEWKILSIGN